MIRHHVFITDASKIGLMTKFGNLDNFDESLKKSKKSKSILGILGWVLTFLELPPYLLLK